jgi:hypothetical protein
MKASEIVQQLAAVLPKHSDVFTDNVNITSLTQVAGTATAVCGAAHGLAAGKQVNITGAQTTIAVSTLTRSGAVGTLVTATAHDLTEGFSTAVEIGDATEAEFNGSFDLLTVPNRTTVTFTMPDSGATVATGSPKLLNGANYLNQYNGLWEVDAVPSTTSFQFTVPATLASPAVGSPVAKSLPRISAVVDEDIIIQAYTKQEQTDVWAFVVLGDVTASKSRYIDSDAVDNLQRGDNFRQQLIQPVTVYVVIPTSAELGARAARDLCEDLLQPLTKSLVFKAYSTGLNVSTKGPLQLVGHGFAAYQRAWYMHAYEFQQVVDLTFEDTVGYDEDVAFRDISLDMRLSPGTGTAILTADINLDEVIV